MFSFYSFHPIYRKLMRSIFGIHLFRCKHKSQIHEFTSSIVYNRLVRSRCVYCLVYQYTSDLCTTRHWSTFTFHNEAKRSINMLVPSIFFLLCSIVTCARENFIQHGFTQQSSGGFQSDRWRLRSQ